MKAFQLKITVLGSKPPIWRRITIPQELSFNALHNAIQYLFGFDGYHLHDFTIPSLNLRIACAYECNDEMCDDISDEIQLITLLSVGMKLKYNYDFGDDWQMKIDIEKEIEQDQNHVILLKAKGDNLMEDSGGIWGYYNNVEILNDKKHSDYKMIKELLGDLSDYCFDFEETQQKLNTITCTESAVCEEDIQKSIMQSANKLMETLVNCDDSIVSFAYESSQLHAWIHNGVNQFIILAQSLNEIYCQIQSSFQHDILYPWYLTGYSVFYTDEEIQIERYENHCGRLMRDDEECLIERYLLKLVDIFDICGKQLPSMHDGIRIYFEDKQMVQYSIDFEVPAGSVEIKPSDDNLASFTKGKEKLEIMMMPVPQVNENDFKMDYYIFVKGKKIKFYKPLECLEYDDIKEEVANCIREYVEQYGRPKSIRMEDQMFIKSLKPLGDMFQITLLNEPYKYDISEMIVEAYMNHNPMEEDEEKALIRMQQARSENEIEDYLSTLSEDLVARILTRISYLEIGLHK